jgi:small subunit ribosomal protein S9
MAEDEKRPEETDETPAEAAEAPAEPEAEAPAEQPAAEAEAQAPAAEAPEVQVEGDEVLADEEIEEIEETPRVKPEIPGADLEVDIVREEDYRGESRWGEEEDEEPAGEDVAEDEEAEPEPIADAAIDLAAGARYTATGKRKTAVARVILKPGDGTYDINGRPLEDFFPRSTLQRNIRQPLETVGYDTRMDVVATMHGGGVSAQAGALRHGISRALIEADPNLRSELKRRGFLTRDARVKERKKAGLKKARKRPQFSKR